VCTIQVVVKRKKSKKPWKTFGSVHFVPPNIQQAEVVKSDEIKLRDLLEKNV